MSIRSQHSQPIILAATGEALSNVQITVNNAGTQTIATIYTAKSGGTTKSNPFTTDTTGLAEFWAEPGSYDIELHDLNGTPRFSDREYTWESVSGGVGGIDGSQLEDDAVTSTKLVNGAVITDKIAASGVTTAKIADLGITAAKIADNSVTTSKILNSNITSDKLGTNSVITTKILDGNITESKLAASGVTSGKISDANVTTQKIADGAVTTVKVADNAIDKEKLSTPLAEKLGVTEISTVRRGKFVLSDNQTTASTSFTTLLTPDIVSSVVLPTDGLIFIGYRALWTLVGASNDGDAAIFIGGNQLRHPIVNSATGVIGATLSASGDFYGPLHTTNAGLIASPSPTSDSSFSSNLQILGPSANSPAVTVIEAQAGTYDISVKFKVNATSGGTLHIKDRKLWCWTIGF